MPRTSWRAVAEKLAERLAIHAFCDAHPVRDADPDCPFCRDRAAYRAYLNAGGRNVSPDDPPGVEVPLHQVPMSDTFHWKRGAH